MNFIEAHEIFYDYCGALSKGNFYNTEIRNYLVAEMLKK